MEEDGFPIRMLAFKDSLVWYNQAGHVEALVQRTTGDSLISSPADRFFGLVLETEQYTARSAQGVFAVSVMNQTGESVFTHSESFSLVEDDPVYGLVDDGHLLVSDARHGLIREVYEDEVKFKERVEDYFKDEIRVLRSSMTKQGGDGPLLVTADLLQYGRADSLFTWLRLGDPGPGATQGGLPGTLRRLEVLPGSNFSLLAVQNGQEHSLHILDGLSTLVSFPWNTWDYKYLGEDKVFLVSDDKFMVVNLGDGRIAAEASSYALYEVADAAYLPGVELFISLRCEPFFTEEGQLAYRNFELHSQDKAGRLLYRGSFGAWAPVLPSITPLTDDRFAVHLYNAVLIYKISD